MCGIFGVLNFTPDRLNDARKALHSLSHRGPDQWGEHIAEDLYLGHRRLSIRDLSENGRQPFVDPATGVAVAVNGETWNDQALRRELEGVRFRSGSDSEVFLHGYLRWGLDDLLARVDGFYAAVIYDPRIRRLYLVKDRWGKKPLYYARYHHQWLFASEIKALLQYAPELRAFDYEGIKHWIAYRGSANPRTIFRGVSKVAQGSYVALAPTGLVETRRHFDLIARAVLAGERPALSPVELDHDIEELLLRAISKRFVADVPVGLQLSGGVDSSLVAVLAKTVQNRPLDTFTVTFSDIRDQAFSEAAYARHVAQYCGFNHHEVGITNQMIADAFERVVYLFDGMLDIPNAIPIYLLCRQAKESITVIMTGEGADELFGGYEKFTWLAATQRARWWARWVPAALFELPCPSERMQWLLYRCYRDQCYSEGPERVLDHLNCFVSPLTMARYFGPLQETLLDGLNREALASLPFLKQALLVDHVTYLNFLLERQDKASMGASMEARLPFLDQALVEYVIRLPSHLLVDDQHNKKPLKRMLARHLGEAFAYRRKGGFPLPIERWFEQESGLGRHWKRVDHDHFLLWQKADRRGLLRYVRARTFDRRQLSYGDSERIWLKWFLSVLAAAQEVFAVTDMA